MRSPRAVWGVTALAVFGAALGWTYRGFWGADLTRDVPVARPMLSEDGALGPIRISDYRAAVWSVARNARALTQRPSRVFDSEMCYPVRDSLALHHPILTPALLGVPLWWALGDPVATFDLVLWLEIALAALAMYALVVSWTGVPAAGIAAGLSFAFARYRLEAPFHFFTHDDLWFLLMLLFAQRVFARRRIADALALGAAAALQIGTSSYPLFAAAFAAAPVGAWLLWRHRRRIPWIPLAVAALPVIAAAAFVLGPYLGMRGVELTQRPAPYFASWSWLLPGGRWFPGFAAAALIAVGALAPRRCALREAVGDPRIALGLAALLVFAIAADGNHNARFGALEQLAAAPADATAAPPAGAPIALPPLYRMLAAWIPGLDVIRLPSALAYQTLQILCIVAGFGAAALLRPLRGRRRALASAALIAAAGAEVLARAPGFAPYPILPDDGRIAAFARLEELGNRGPLLEVPIAWDSAPFRFEASSAQMLATAYHGRRTSGCRGSFIPPQVREHERTAAALLGPAGARRAREAGFTTVIVHHRGAPGRAYLERVRAGARQRGDLQELLHTDELTAFAIRGATPPPDDAAADANGAPAATHVVLIVVDTLRADHLGAYGYARDVSPHIDAFAAGATRYTRAIASAPWTLPSHASMFTGLPSYRHGAHSFFVDAPWPKNVYPLGDEQWTLAEALRARGYRTAAFVANAGFLDRSSGLDQGFGVYHVQRLPAARLNERVFAWLRQPRGDAPLFLFVNYMDAHRHYNTRPRPGLLEPPASRDTHLLDRLERAVMPGTDPVPEALAQAVIDQYDTGIAHADEAVGALLDRLRALSLYDGALIVVTSDHGEYFGEHHLVEHHLDVYQAGVHVPLIVKRPGQTEPETRDEVTSSRHLPQLIASALPAPLGAALAGEFPAAPGDGEPVVSEAYYAFSDVLNNPLWAPRFRRIRRAVYEWPFALIHSSDGAHELYDLEADPLERTDLAAQQPERVARLAGALEARLRAAGVDPRPQPVAADASERQPIPNDLLRELRALGYAAPE